MPLSLIKRLVLGVPLTPAQMDQNLTDIENAVNGQAAQLSASLNPDGTLKNNTVSTASIQDRAVTLAKRAYDSNFYAQDTGAANAMLIAFVPALTVAYSGGMLFYVRVIATNTGASTLQVSTNAPAPVKKFTSSGLVDLGAGDMIQNGVYEFMHDGTQFILLNPTPTTVTFPKPTFIPVPVTFYSGGAIGWTTYDASGAIPAGSSAAIVQVKAASSPLHSQGTIEVDFRKDNTSPTLQGCYVSSSAGDTISAGQQGIYPITTARKFDYQVVTISAGTADLTLIGYLP